MENPARGPRALKYRAKWRKWRQTGAHTQPDSMNLQTVFALLHCCIFKLCVQSAPVVPVDSSLQQTVERAKTLVEKILREVPAVHRAAITMEGLTLDPSSHPTNLQMMVRSLGIPPAPILKPLSQHFTMEECVSRMSAGVRLHQELLGVLSSKVSAVTDVRADLRDLNTHISKIKELTQLGGVAEQYQSPDLASRLHGNYDIQVAAHVTLQQLRSFCHDLIRSLRHIATYRPAGAATL
ncbi:uncharacterized protein LOC143013831 [Genypterus blacodes]|uniref:uncharacterized protein LOC143013831 n=1 Tax=Genypterus blacodes TaxID=154954 RepID=UPI003F75D228